ncbi:hypothetical protein F2Q68_00030449 [Brassica cretica]|uniref:Uncharacterized protein n=1 Tax=Brassica cretica TaxID=69181 RepID=A0A8S9GJ63_BRACR|nr:hypothetical protein F2Q68_00030449 [Brassica cretica]
MISPARFDDSGISPARFNDTGVRRDLAKTTRSNKQNTTISHHERSNQKNAKGRSLGSRGGSKVESYYGLKTPPLSTCKSK